MTQLELDDIKLVGELPFDWDRFNGKTFLISGGTGFIGSFLIHVLRYRNEAHHQGIKAISLTRRGGTSDDTVTYLQQNIANPIDLDNDVDYVLHLASNTHPKAYAEDPIGTIINNIDGCNHLLQCAVEYHAERFLLASSVEIYGEGSETPMEETYGGYCKRRGYCSQEQG